MLAAALEAAKALLATCSQAELVQLLHLTEEPLLSSQARAALPSRLLKVPLPHGFKMDAVPCLNQTPLPYSLTYTKSLSRRTAFFLYTSILLTFE